MSGNEQIATHILMVRRGVEEPPGLYMISIAWFSCQRVYLYFSWWYIKHNTNYTLTFSRTAVLGSDTHASAYSFAVAMETVDNISEVHALVHTLTTDS